MELVDNGCPQLDINDKRCEAAAEVVRREDWESTDGLVEHAKTVCVMGHVLYMPAYLLELTSEK